MVVSGETSASARLEHLFKDAGFTVLECPDIAAATQMMRSAKLDLIVLQCRSLVGGELTFCGAVAAAPCAPLLVLATNADVVDEIVALELGADDLLTGEVADRLVLARARALLRRTRPLAAARLKPEATGQWRLNATTRTATSPGGQTVLLSPGDASALHLFLTNPGVVFTCQAGALALGAGKLDARGFRTTVCRLRKKLNPLYEIEPIQTVRGIGYMFAPQIGLRTNETRDSAPGPRGGARPPTAIAA